MSGKSRADLLADLERKNRELERSIEDLRATEETLRELASIQSAILNGASLAILSTAPDGTVQSMNPAATHLLGYTPWEMVGRHSPAILHDAEELRAEAHEIQKELGRPVAVGFDVLAERARARLPSEREWSWIRKDGSRFPAWVSVTALRDDEERIHGFLLIGQDITERKAIDRMKNEFVSIVSHELRTPLTSIRGALGLLEAGVLGPQNERALRMVKIARRNADRLIRLIGDILDLEKIEAGKLSLKLEPLDAEGLVSTAVDEITGMAEQAKVSVRHETAEVPRIRADRDRVVQVLVNLLSNAIKFSPEGSEVAVRAEAAPGDRVRFSVSDRGPGIPAGKIGALFGKFQQLDSSDSRKFGGTGLGLSIAKAIVEQHGGTIGVESAGGRGDGELPDGARTGGPTGELPDGARTGGPTGSTFWFELLTVDAETTGDLVLAERSAQAASVEVLLVASDEGAAAALRRRLEEDGFGVAVVRTAEEAERAVGSSLPDVLLVDARDSDRSGAATAERLAARDRTRHFPRVVLTAGDSIDGLADGLRAAASAVARFKAVVIDDDPATRVVLGALLKRCGIEAIDAGDGAAGVALVRQERPDLIVLDLGIPWPDGYHVVEILRREGILTPLLVYTGSDLIAADRKALTLGPTRFLTKSRASHEQFQDAVQALLADKIARRVGGV